MSHLQVHELESIKVKPEARQCGETDSRHMASGQSSPFHPNSPVTSWHSLLTVPFPLEFPGEHSVWQ